MIPGSIAPGLVFGLALRLVDGDALALDCEDVAALVAVGVPQDQVLRGRRRSRSASARLRGPCARERGSAELIDRLVASAAPASAAPQVPAAPAGPPAPPSADFMLKSGKTVTVVTLTRLGPATTKRSAVVNPESQVFVVKEVSTGKNVLGEPVSSTFVQGYRVDHDGSVCWPWRPKRTRTPTCSIRPG